MSAIWWYLSGMIYYFLVLIIMDSVRYKNIKKIYWLPDIFFSYFLFLIVILLQSHSSYLIYKKIEIFGIELVLYLCYNISYINWVFFFMRKNLKTTGLIFSIIAAFNAVACIYMYYLQSDIAGWLLIPSIIIIFSSTVLNYHIWISRGEIILEDDDMKFDENFDNNNNNSNRGYIDSSKNNNNL